MTEDNFPEAFVRRVQEQFGDESAALLAALNLPPAVSVRKREDAALWEDEEVIPYCPGAVYLGHRPVFTTDPRFHLGEYYPQESSSMVIGAIFHQLNQSRSFKKILDTCAAPGGKSLLVLSAMDDDAILISNEIVGRRNFILQENLCKWADPRSIVIQNQVKEIPYSETFDCIVLDAPCSGEGMFRKDPGARKEWSLEGVKNCSGIQSELIQEAYRLLRPGGILIYSTCTFNREENEMQCVAMVESDKWFSISDVNMPQQARRVKEDGFTAWRFLPHEGKGEGFFCAIWEKKSSDSREKKRFKGGVQKVDWMPLPKKESGEVEAFLSVTGIPMLRNAHNEVSYFLGNFSEWQALNIRQLGVPLGQWVKKFIPHVGVLRSDLASSNCERVSVTDEQALSLLRGEDLRMEENVSTGWAIAQWKGRDLTWIKGVQNRWSNHYPKEWRIRHL
jgi:16S rRNA C967 or C1407 C5-methylase (RsmB/RsmF family)/NOL1/NOP2/fmu family ribosome biogenesis protein